VTLRAPRPPTVPPPQRLPLVATIAPIVASLVLYLITRSPFTLAFAALGPVIAIASTADRAMQRRKTAKRERLRFAAAIESSRADIERAHADARLERGRAAPSVADLIAGLSDSSLLWREKSVADLEVRIGTATLPSDLRFDGTDSETDDTDEVKHQLAELAESAAALRDAPVSVRPGTGIGIVGSPALAASAARAIVVQLAARVSPASTILEIPAGESWRWLEVLPNACVGESDDGVIRLRGESETRIAIAATTAGLPRGLDTVLEVDPLGIASIPAARDATRRDTVRMDGVRVDLLGANEAELAVEQLAAVASREGIAGPSGHGLADAVAFGALEQPEDVGLSAVLGPAAVGRFQLDLVSDGPHAIIGGTTGSGKSELLISWVLGMSAHRSPDRVTFLFVDFKGGAAFDSLRVLPHCVGVMTDLDAAHSLRALVSLGAELRHRERLLAAAGLRSIDDAPENPPFPRLVVVVDEYAALLETHSSLNSVFADIAARGRSLGVHLVLCTQRPAGVVRDSILANCALRMSLRVASAADSAAVIGSDAAARLPARPIGRVLVSVAGAEPTMAQVAHSSPTDIAVIAERWASAEAPRAPWCPPLPELVEPFVGIPSTDIPFGTVDLPHEQRQDDARWDPARHGNLLVVGGAGSGKSGVVRAIAQAPSLLTRTLVPSTVPALWDALGAVTEPTVLLIDDLDAIVAGCQEDYQAALLDRLSRVLRDGPASGIHCVLTAQRVGGSLHAVTALTSSLLTLRMPNRQEHVLAGADPATFLADAPPGAGYWRGDRVQVAGVASSASRPLPLARRAISVATAVVAVASTRPEEIARRIGEFAPGRQVTVLGGWRAGESAEPAGSPGGGRDILAPPILIGDPEVWQSQWTLLASLRRSGELLFDGCSLPEVRALTRSRELPPPFPRGERPVWILDRDGEFSRAKLVP
jgi:S-DNA-T family DNA segregation ATPase FtsK/SpoIIIE